MPTKSTAPDRLLSAGLRATPARLTLLGLFERLARPVGVDELYRTLLAEHSDIRPSTMYRVLRDLDSAGLILRESIPGHTGMRAVYSLPPEGAAEAAHHMYCTHCGHCMVLRNGEERT